jgi:predicted glutamine amidotransferase
MAVTEENCHPFVRGDFALAHNGGIYPMSRLHQILPPEWEATVRGTTDSERYTLAVVAGREASGGSVADVIVDVVVRLFAEWSPSSLNAMCLTPDSVVVVSAFNPNGQAPVPSQSVDQYYSLGYRESAEGIVVASSGIDQPKSQGWRLIDNMTAVEIHRRTLAIEYRAVPVEASAPAVPPKPDRAPDLR